jgi:hypothetical protein
MFQYSAAFMHEKTHLMATLNFIEDICSTLWQGGEAQRRRPNETSPFSDNWVVSMKFMRHTTNAETIIESSNQRKTPANHKISPELSKRLFKHQQPLKFVMFPHKLFNCSLSILDDEILLFYASTKPLLRHTSKIFSFSGKILCSHDEEKSRGRKVFRCIH